MGFGSGVGALSFPLMVIACGNAFLAAGIMLPLLIVADGVGVATWWRQWKWRPIALLLPGVAVGTAVGAGILWYLRSLDRRSPETPGAAVLQMVIGLIALTFVVLELLRRRTGKVYTFGPVLWQATLAGALLGISSTLAHSGGPIAMMYLLSQRLSKERFVASTVVLFCIVNQSKLAAYVAVGMIDVHSLALGRTLCRPSSSAPSRGASSSAASATEASRESSTRFSLLPAFICSTRPRRHCGRGSQRPRHPRIPRMVRIFSRAEVIVLELLTIVATVLWLWRTVA